MTEEAEEEVLGNDSFELASLFSFSLNHRILPRCATSARIEPDSRETLVAVNNESSLHIPDKIKCITTVPFGMGYDYIVVGTESQVGKLGELDRMILCGGNCAIWGFDETGKDVYWTVTGDAVTTMCFCDFDGDGEMELIIGSPDSELRIFKNDLMRAELLETDAVIVLQGFDRNRFGYALANGTVGMYHQDQRLWRIKSKSVITAILPYPNNDMITCAWNSGKIDVRSINENGEVVCRDSTLSGQTVIAGFISMMNNDDELEFTVVTAEGKVNTSRDCSFTQIELSNFEQEEQLSESEKEKDFRIPIGTSVECKLFVSKSDRNLYLVLEASHEILDWVMDTFLIDIDYPIDPEEDLMEIRFLGLASKRDQELCIKHFQSDGKTIIYHECMETAGNIIQSLCDYFVIDTLEAHAEFPDKFAEVEEICNELDSMYDVRDRLTTDLTEKQTLLMEVVVRAEDAIVIDDITHSGQHQLIYVIEMTNNKIKHD
ncbi:FG-GAP repeat protein [Ancylostoma ceylanicum]|uniref:FG-GAP repeat protein n=1 Tax=Ancylostoma ceylanicum TaxID=53326 RepID=A0A0D6L853_9BILA|nr:FG-GAP repeat protein [Ancylostoma ceylanicum]